MYKQDMDLWTIHTSINCQIIVISIFSIIFVEKLKGGSSNEIKKRAMKSENFNHWSFENLSATNLNEEKKNENLSIL